MKGRVVPGLVAGAGWAGRRRAGPPGLSGTIIDMLTARLMRAEPERTRTARPAPGRIAGTRGSGAAVPGAVRVR
jgi:hypothetical protein